MEKSGVGARGGSRSNRVHLDLSALNQLAVCWGDEVTWKILLVCIATARVAVGPACKTLATARTLREVAGVFDAWRVFEKEDRLQLDRKSVV